MKKVLLALAVALCLAAPAQAQRQERGAGASAAKPTPQPQKAGGNQDMRRDRMSRQDRDKLRQDLIDANRDMKGRK